MPFCLLWAKLPELAEQETRTIFVTEACDGLPVGAYSFREMFCDEPGCDCRRAFFWVDRDNRQEPEAVIAWGWESKAFYKKWMHGGSKEDVELLQGPVLNMGSPQTALAPHLLELFKSLLLSDSAYVERVKRHYALFRDVIDSRTAPAGSALKLLGEEEPSLQLPSLSGSAYGLAVRPGPKIGRNAPCPCGSGKKYKKCCGVEDAWVGNYG